MDDEDGIGINDLDIYATEIGSTVEMNESIVRMDGLRVTNSSLRCEGATEKRSTVDNNDINSLKVTGSNLRCEEMTEKKSTVDDNSVRTISLRMSGLRKTGSSLRHDRRLQCR